MRANPRVVTSMALAFLGALAPRGLRGQSAVGDHTAQINGVGLHYRILGAGTPLVLLHPFGGCGAIWRPFLDSLAAEYQLIIVDMRGHGESTNPSHRFTHRQSARDILALMDLLDIRHFKAIGLSSGAMTLLHVATLQPQRVDAMVLVSATSTFPPQARAIMRQSTSPQSLPPDVLAEYRACAARGDDQVRELVTQFHAFGDDRDDMVFSPRTLHSITARTLFVHGDRDALFPVSIAVGLYHAVAGSALWIIPYGDHLPVFGPRAPLFLMEARRFLASTVH